jgi:hypothetical protein
MFTILGRGGESGCFPVAIAVGFAALSIVAFIAGYL